MDQNNKPKEQDEDDFYYDSDPFAPLDSSPKLKITRPKVEPPPKEEELDVLELDSDSDSDSEYTEDIELDADYLNTLLEHRDELVWGSIEFMYLLTYDIQKLINIVTKFFRGWRIPSKIIPYMSETDEYKFEMFLYTVLDIDKSYMRISSSDIYQIQELLKKEHTWMIY
jgi:hypothetical protein